MPSIQDILPEPISDDQAEAIREIIVRKITGPVRMYVEAVRAVEAEYGKDTARNLLFEEKWASRIANNPLPTSGEERSLNTFCASLEHSCIGTHEWEKLEETDTRHAYRFTRCAWAEVFQALDAADIGFWICEGDGPGAKLYNPDIEFTRTKTLMEEHDCCDHVYYIEAEEDA